jgi:hypothetical protein
MLVRMKIKRARVHLRKLYYRIYFYFRPVRLTPKEMAEVLFQVNQELKAEGLDRTDWQLEILEKMEREGQISLSVRAELYRKGLRHSKSEA